MTFEYGTASVVTDPVGAAIFSGDKDLGQTPKTLTELKPGTYRFRLQKSGYTPTVVGFEIV